MEQVSHLLYRPDPNLFGEEGTRSSLCNSTTMLKPATSLVSVGLLLIDRYLPSVLPAKGPTGIKFELHTINFLMDRSFPLRGNAMTFERS